MSTKIYNGIKFKSNNIYEVMHQLRDLRNEAILIGVDRLIEKDLKYFILMNNLSNDREFDILQKLKKSLKKENRFLSDPDFLFEVVIFPHESGKLYGYYITDRIRAYEDMLFDQDIAEDFHYQNQSDQPEDINDDEWAHREEVWDNLLSGLGNLMENGMLFQIVKAEHLFHYDHYNKISSAIKQICQRIQRTECRQHRNMWE